MTFRRRSVIVLAALVGCGDALVGSDFHGDPLFRIDGRIVDFDGTGPELSQAEASLFWSLTGETTTSPSELSGQQAVDVGIEFPSMFTFNIFERPSVPGLRDSPYLVGLILLYSDEDGDGAYSESELQGGAFENAVLYAPEALTASESPTRLALPAGFSVVDLPLPCDGTGPDLSGQDCGVPLGAPCVLDADCGDQGQCMMHDGGASYPDGYCVLPSASACVPAGGALIDVVDPEGFITDLVWGQGCRLATECRDSNYTCALDVAACVPVTPVAIFVTRAFSFDPVCEGGARIP